MLSFIKVLPFMNPPPVARRETQVHFLIRMRHCYVIARLSTEITNIFLIRAQCRWGGADGAGQRPLFLF